MTRWVLEFDPRAIRDLNRLDPPLKRRLVAYLEERVLTRQHPSELGRALGGELAGYWRYRVGDYRILCDLREELLIVRVVAAGHRKDVYD